MLPLARFFHGRAVAVDPERRTVDCELVADGSRTVLAYDQLVVGTGGREPVATVTGLAEHGFLLRGPGDIERLADRVRRLASVGPTSPYAAGPRRPQPPTPSRQSFTTATRTVVIAGGGIAGVSWRPPSPTWAAASHG